MRNVALALTSALLLFGCEAGGSDDPAGDQPTKPLGLEWHECPADVDLVMVSRHECATLTVPVDHDEPDGSTLDLLVVKAWPTGVPEGQAVGLSMGFNLGEPAQDGGSLAALATRLGVPMVNLAPRGVGPHGGVSLACTELDGFTADAADDPDAAARSAFVAAVTECRERLSADGVDVGDFGVADEALDVEDLRSALEIEEWHVLVSYGSRSLISGEYAAVHPDRVRAIVADSPQPTRGDPFALGAEGTRSALAALFAECARDQACARRYPDLEGRWRRALEQTMTRPLTGTDGDVAVLVDASKLLRAVRSILGGDGPAHVPELPGIIAAAAEGTLHPTLAGLVAAEPAYCLGYRPLCNAQPFSMGVFLTQTCPSVGHSVPADEEPVYREVFFASPYRDACEEWQVEESSPAPPVQVPTLVLTGQLDSWSRPEWLPRSAVLVRGATHDVTGFAPCAMGLRNAWVARPALPPKAERCDDQPGPAWQ